MKTFLLVIFFLLQALDLYTTKKTLELGGTEGNKILKKIIDRFSPSNPLLTIFCLKGILLAVVLFTYSMLPLWFMTTLCMFYGLIVYNNVRVNTKLRKQ